MKKTSTPPKMPRMTESRQVDKSLADRPDFVDIHQAAKVLDLSLDALRKRITRGTIQAAKENGHWYVHIEDNRLDSPDNVQTTDHPGDRDHVDGNELAIAMMEARISSLESQLASKDAQTETQLAAKDQQIGELHRLLAQTALNQAPAKPWWKIW